MKPYQRLAEHRETHGHKLLLGRERAMFTLRVDLASGGNLLSGRFALVDRDEAAVELLSKLALKA